MATTEAALIERVRGVITDLGYREAIGFDFSRLPSGQEDGAFTVRLTSDLPRGGMGFREEAQSTVLVTVARSLKDDYQAARATSYEDARAVLSALVHDGADTSGEYCVEDTGRSVEIVTPPGASYLEARLRLAVNFEATL